MQLLPPVSCDVKLHAPAPTPVTHVVKPPYIDADTRSAKTKDYWDDGWLITCHRTQLHTGDGQPRVRWQRQMPYYVHRHQSVHKLFTSVCLSTDSRSVTRPHRVRSTKRFTSRSSNSKQFHTRRSHQRHCQRETERLTANDRFSTAIKTVYEVLIAANSDDLNPLESWGNI